MTNVSVTFNYSDHERIKAAPEVIIDGVRVESVNIRLSAEVDTIEDAEAMAANGFTSRVYMPGISTWMLYVDEQPVFVTTDKPVQINTAEYMRFSWGEAQL